jgi:hypothetical protein
MAEILFNRIKIDSLKILIPFNQVQVIDAKFNQDYTNLKVYSTGEITEEFNRNTNVFCTSKGIKVKLEVARIKFGRISEKGYQGEEYLIFQPSSKLLKENYFDGINLQNLRTIYDYLMNLSIVRFSYESLLKANFKDVDFCVDYPATIEEFRLMNRNIEFNVLKELKHFVKQFDKYSGLQFNQRKEATPTRPFVKTYHKSTELLDKSNEFYYEFLKVDYCEVIAKGIGRYEITVKDAKFKKHYKIESMTIEQLLNIPYVLIENMFRSFLPNYLHKSTRIQKMGNTPTEIIHSNCINQFIHDGKSEQEIIHLMLKGIDERSSLSRSKKILQELFQQVNDPDQLNQNNELKKGQNEFYKTIGFYDGKI